MPILMGALDEGMALRTVAEVCTRRPPMGKRGFGLERDDLTLNRLGIPVGLGL